MKSSRRGPKTLYISDPGLWRWVEEMAKRDNRSVSNFVETVLDRARKANRLPDGEYTNVQGQ